MGFLNKSTQRRAQVCPWMDGRERARAREKEMLLGLGAELNQMDGQIELQ